MSRTPVSQATLHKLEVFSLVGQLESVSRAAERVGIAQPVVTAHIRDLEEKLGVRLVERQGRRIRLTEAGARTMRWASEIVTRTRELERELTDPTLGAAGSVVIAASMTVGSYVLPDMLARFRRVQGDGDITVHISNPRAATDSVRDGSCDFALAILDPRHALDGLMVERLWEEQLILIAAPDFPIEAQMRDPAAIAALPFITSPRNQVRREIEDDALRAYGIVRSRIVLELGHPEAMKQAVRRGAGVAFVLETSVRQDVEKGDLRVIGTAPLNLPSPMFMVYRRGKSFSPFQRLLAEFVRDAARSVRTELGHRQTRPAALARAPRQRQTVERSKAR
jgi:LysR family transcriptional regulator, low CO2-responsive transcriptional regulator